MKLLPEQTSAGNADVFLFAEIQSKRQERKRRTTANPVYSGAVFEPEVRPRLPFTFVNLESSKVR